jgi:ParB family chromosome partitioning protein
MHHPHGRTNTMADGRFEPDYPISTIDQDGVYRHDLGDLGPLCDSMTALGLLTPIVVTGDGALLCGKRRLAAAVKLGWESVPVWIPAKVSDTLRLSALFDDETLHKSLTPIEQAELYAEYEALYAEQSRLRMEATRFRDGNTAWAGGNGAGEDGGADSAPPSPVASKARVKAAQAVTGTNSYERLEQIRELQRIAADDDQSPWVRSDATEALAGINQDGKVNGRWQHVKVQQQLAVLEDTASDPDLPEPLRQAAAEAFTTIRTQDTTANQFRAAKTAGDQIRDMKAATPPPAEPVDPHASEHRQVSVLVGLLRREHGWWDRNDPEVFGQFADEDQWGLVDSYVAEASRFLETARACRTAL